NGVVGDQDLSESGRWLIDEWSKQDADRGVARTRVDVVVEDARRAPSHAHTRGELRVGPAHDRTDERVADDVGVAVAVDVDGTGEGRAGLRLAVERNGVAGNAHGAATAMDDAALLRVAVEVLVVLDDGSARRLPDRDSGADGVVT